VVWFQGDIDDTECKHELWPMTLLGRGTPIPGVFACRRCFFDLRNSSPTMYSRGALRFTNPDARDMVFRPQADHHVHQFHM